MYVQRENDQVVRQYAAGDGWQCSEVVRSTPLGKELIRCKPVYDGDEIGKFVSRLPSTFSAVKVMFKKHQNDIKKDVEFKKCFSDWMSYVKENEEQGLCLPLFSDMVVPGNMMSYDPTTCVKFDDTVDMIINIKCDAVSTCFVGSKVSDMRMFVRYTFGLSWFALIAAGYELVDDLDLRDYGIRDGDEVLVVRGRSPDPIRVCYEGQVTSFFGVNTKELYQFVMSRFGIVDSFWLVKNTTIVHDRGLLNDYGIREGDVLTVCTGPLGGGSSDDELDEPDGPLTTMVYLGINGKPIVQQQEKEGNFVVPESKADVVKKEKDMVEELVDAFRDMFFKKKDWGDVIEKYKHVDAKVAESWSCYPVNVEKLNEVMKDAYSFLDVPLATNLFPVVTCVSVRNVDRVRAGKCVYRRGYDGPEYMLVIHKNLCFLLDKASTLHYVLGGKVDNCPFTVATCQIVVDNRTGDFGCVITDLLFYGFDLRQEDIKIRIECAKRVASTMQVTANMHVSSKQWKFVRVAHYDSVKVFLPKADLEYNGYVFVPHHAHYGHVFCHTADPSLIKALVVIEKDTKVPQLMAIDDEGFTDFSYGFVAFGTADSSELQFMDSFTVCLKWNYEDKLANGKWKFVKLAEFGACADKISYVNEVIASIREPVHSVRLLKYLSG